MSRLKHVALKKQPIKCNLTLTIDAHLKARAQEAFGRNLSRIMEAALLDALDELEASEGGKK